MITLARENKARSICQSVLRFHAASHAYMASRKDPDEKLKFLMKDFIYWDAEKVFQYQLMLHL
jgi:hypothetical protein